MTGCISNQKPEVRTEIVPVREPVYPPKEYLQDCEATFQSRKVKHIILGLDRALRECNSQIEAIRAWKDGIQSPDQDSEKEE